MLRFFRINDPYRLVIIFLILVLIRVGQGFIIPGTSYFELKYLLLGEWLHNGFSLYSEAYDYTGPLAAFIYKLLDFLFGRSPLMHRVLNAFLIIIQAGIFNQILLKNKAYNENSYMPAFLYMILMVSIPDFMTLSPQLLSLTFILLAFRNVLRRIDNQVTDELFLNSGVFIGIATMIYLPSAVFFFVFLVSLILFSSAVARRLLLYSFGFLLIFSLCTLYFYWLGSFQVFIESFITQSILLSASDLLSLNELLILSIPILFIFLLSVIKTWSSARLTNYQQKIQQVIWLMFFGGIASALLSNEKVGHELVYAVPVTAYFWTHYFIQLRRKFFKTIMPSILIIGMIVFSFYSYQNLVKSVVVDETILVESKTMILGEQLENYLGSEMSTPCFENQLCKEAMEGINYYKEASTFYEIIRRVDPEYIIDNLGCASDLFYRFPILEDKYQKIDRKKYVKISN